MEARNVVEELEEPKDKIGKCDDDDEIEKGDDEDEIEKFDDENEEKGEDDKEKGVEEEDFFLELFDQAFERRRPVGIASDDKIRSSIQKMVDYFNINRSAAGLCAQSRFSSVEDYLGYFYWHSPLSAAATRNKVLAAIRDCEIFRACFHQKILKVVSIGGGAGSDLVGLLSALYEISAIKYMDLSLIEKNKKWKQYFQAVERLLRKQSTDFGNASKFIKSKRVTTSFFCVDMIFEMIPRCVKGANLVWMKGFLSTLRDDHERFCVTNRIISSMSRGALLVVMESLAYDQFDIFVEKKKLERLYNSKNGYFLNLNSQPEYRIIRSSKIEIIIFKKI